MGPNFRWAGGGGVRWRWEVGWWRRGARGVQEIGGRRGWQLPAPAPGSTSTPRAARLPSNCRRMVLLRLQQVGRGHWAAGITKRLL